MLQALTVPILQCIKRCKGRIYEKLADFVLKWFVIHKSQLFCENIKDNDFLRRLELS